MSRALLPPAGEQHPFSKEPYYKPKPLPTWENTLQFPLQPPAFLLLTWKQIEETTIQPSVFLISPSLSTETRTVNSKVLCQMPRRQKLTVWFVLSTFSSPSTYTSKAELWSMAVLLPKSSRERNGTPLLEDQRNTQLISLALNNWGVYSYTSHKWLLIMEFLVLY